MQKTFKKYNISNLCKYSIPYMYSSRIQIHLCHIKMNNIVILALQMTLLGSKALQFLQNKLQNCDHIVQLKKVWGFLLFLLWCLLEEYSWAGGFTFWYRIANAASWTECALSERQRLRVIVFWQMFGLDLLQST